MCLLFGSGTEIWATFTPRRRHFWDGRCLPLSKTPIFYRVATMPAQKYEKDRKYKIQKSKKQKIKIQKIQKMGDAPPPPPVKDANCLKSRDNLAQKYKKKD